MENSTKSLHPLILIAAGSVTIASLAAAAHFTGLLPTHGSEPPAVVASVPAAPPAAVPAPAAQPAPATAQAAPSSQSVPSAQPEPSRPAPRQHVQRHASEAPAHPARTSNDDWRYDGGTRRVSTNDAGIDVIPSRPTPAPVAATPPVCRECGTVESVREVASQGEGTGLGAIAGGVLGGVLGHQVGRGTGKDLATIAGAVGGAFAGNQVEKNVRSNKQYEVAVRFDDGSVHSYTVANTAWHTGDRVRLSNGALAPL